METMKVVVLGTGLVQTPPQAHDQGATKLGSVAAVAAGGLTQAIYSAFLAAAADAVVATLIRKQTPSEYGCYRISFKCTYSVCMHIYQYTKYQTVFHSSL